MEAEKPLPPESPGRGTLRQEETGKRSSFLSEGQGTERRQRSSLPQVPGMEKQTVAVPWGSRGTELGPKSPHRPRCLLLPPHPIRLTIRQQRLLRGRRDWAAAVSTEVCEAEQRLQQDDDNDDNNSTR